ncbi:FimB/Mfa2 family fimbrial subunit [Mucilaginibacter angelicae]|uniref:FimB/Mfa2 family fimbrial subunit n=1 Tax=Mucilaginibacter angelicae TaxID=869718 RepID=A0ABV6LDI3_9SPHI
MKKLFLGLALICMAVLSCKKEQTSTNGQTPHDGKYKVTFNVGFSQQTANFQTGALKVNRIGTEVVVLPLSSVVDVICFAVYNSDGNRLHLINQSSSDPNFGVFTDNLNSGTYTVVVAAGKDGLTLSNDIVYQGREIYNYVDNSNLSTDILTYGVLASKQPKVFDKDAFYKKITITVPGTTSQSVSLDRITSQVQVVVEDALPANAKTLELHIDKTADKFYVGSATPANMNAFLHFNSILPTAAIGTLNYTFATTAFLAMPSSTQTIGCSSSLPVNSNDILTADIAQSVVPNVSCLPNKKTILTGNLFGGNGKPTTNGFHLFIDTSWNTSPVKSF